MPTFLPAPKELAPLHDPQRWSLFAQAPWGYAEAPATPQQFALDKKEPPEPEPDDNTATYIAIGSVGLAAAFYWWMTS